MKILSFTIRHAMFEDLMCERRLARVFQVEDLGHERDHYQIIALVREQDLDAVVERASDRPVPVEWPKK
ncbi:MAG: hypothetical protein KDJ27_17705 [Gammaproteobacteria bacterium]|nr:hypothetical protein [Gammaproteobacteria bacterium]MCB1925549.1 hypothetical protein [Gammaproteobacteria bacterium]